MSKTILSLRATWSLVMIALSVCLFSDFIVSDARALSNREGKKGLFADLSITLDGVTVRRFRDVEAGTLCYVASSPISTSPGTNWGTQPAISCVGWQP